jgi:hypothetical protein
VSRMPPVAVIGGLRQVLVIGLMLIGLPGALDVRLRPELLEESGRGGQAQGTNAFLGQPELDAGDVERAPLALEGGKGGIAVGEAVERSDRREAKGRGKAPELLDPQREQRLANLDVHEIARLGRVGRQDGRE